MEGYALNIDLGKAAFNSGGLDSTATPRPV